MEHLKYDKLTLTRGLEEHYKSVKLETDALKAAVVAQTRTSETLQNEIQKIKAERDELVKIINELGAWILKA